MELRREVSDMRHLLTLLALAILPACPTLPIVRYELATDAPATVTLTTSVEWGLVLVAHGEGTVDVSADLVSSGFPLMEPVSLSGGGWVAARAKPEPEVVFADEREGLPEWAQDE